MFMVILPIAPLLVVLNNVIEIRVDAQKLLREVQRPVPFGAQDIGSWQAILNVMAVASAITNTALILFATDAPVLGLESFSSKLLAFIAAEHVLLGIKWMAAAWIDDVPGNVLLQLERQEYLVKKHLLGVAEEEAEHHPAALHGGTQAWAGEALNPEPRTPGQERGVDGGDEVFVMEPVAVVEATQTSDGVSEVAAAAAGEESGVLLVGSGAGDLHVTIGRPKAPSEGDHSLLASSEQGSMDYDAGYGRPLRLASGKVRLDWVVYDADPQMELAQCSKLEEAETRQTSSGSEGVQGDTASATSGDVV
jgi:hypothetical protein